MSALKVAVATAAFAGLHSLLASTRVKERIGAKSHRVLFNAQGALTFGALAWLIARQPKQTIYEVNGAGAALLRTMQLAGIAFGAAAAHATGIATLAGIDPTTPAPAAQGPEAGNDGELRIRGPFRVMRHPLNFAPLAPFWCTPHMTTRRLAFNLVATAYLVIGSVHEERRLLQKYGERYARYQQDGPPFFLPRFRRKR
jgi:protein-S-isoprenylcysteine O-methyltransferase Ste14